MNNRLFSIQEVADILGVSTKTLRRWDQRGRLVATRTIGNQRRYTQNQIDEFKILASLRSGQNSKFKNVSSVSLESAVEPFFKPVTPKEFKPTQGLPSVLSGLPSGSFLKHHFLLMHKGEVSTLIESQAPTEVSEEPSSPAKAGLNPFKIGFVFASLVLLLSLGGAFVLTKYNVVAGLTQTKEQFAKFIANLPQISLQVKKRDLNQDLSFVPQKDIVGSVLAAEASGSSLILNVNIPSIFSQPVGIGITTQEPSAILDVASEDKGFLAPRMTEVQMKAITSPATGLFVYNTTTNHYNMYNGTAWQGVLTSIGDSILGEAFTKDGKEGNSLYFHGTGGGKTQVTSGASSGTTNVLTLPDVTGTFVTTGNLTTITKVGTVSTGVWNGTILTVPYGGTGVGTLTGIVLGNGSGVMTGLTTSAGIATAISDETGTGLMVFNTSPVFDGNVLPTTTLTSNLGSSSLYWNNVYASNFIAALNGTAGYWQRSSSAISPTNITDDVLIGATASNSASLKFGFINVASGTPTATISGNLSLAVASGSAKAQTLNLLNNGTLNIQRSPGGDAGLTTSMFFQSNGNVGIGNTAPGTVLDVTGAGTFSSNLAVNGGSITTTTTTGNLFNTTATTLNIGGAGTTLTIGATTGTATIRNATTALTGVLNVNGSGTSYFTGNVGLGGQTTPLTALDVTGSASLSANVSLRGSGTAHTFNILDNGTLNFQRSPSGDAGVTNVLYLGSNGNVGIGTTSPTAIFEVQYGGSPLIGKFGGGSGTPWDVLTLWNNNNGTNSGPRLTFDTQNLGGTEKTMARISGIMTTRDTGSEVGDFVIETMKSGTVTEAMRVLGNGNVGIGTATPLTALDVVGSASLSANLSLRGAGTAHTLDILGNGTLNIRRSPGGDAGVVTAMFVDTSGNVGINTATPLFRLDVQDSQSATAAAQIYNTNSGTDADGLVIKLGNTSTTVASSTNHFLSFETFGIGIVGSVQGSGGKGVTYATGGIADFAEYFKKDQSQSIPYGSVVCFDNAGLAVACDNNSNKIIGVASERPAFLGGENLGDRSVPVGLVGQVRTRVSTNNGVIKIGDPLTTSSVPGVAVKATSIGQILGKAIEGYDGQGEGNVLVSVNISWYNPSIYVSYDGTLAGMASTVSRIGDQLTSQEKALALQGDALQAQSASVSAALNAASASIVANDSLFKDLKDKVSALESKIGLLSLQAQQQASISAFLTEIVKSQVLGASASATLSLGDVELNNATISQDLMVLGRATVTNLGVTGNINAGLLAIHGLDGEINTLSGDLYLQKAGLGGVNIMNGKIVMDTKGNLMVAGTITADTVEAKNYTVLGSQSIGSATIPAGVTSIEVSTAIASESSKIFLTSTSLTDKQITVVEKLNGKFKVAIPQPTTSPISFDWWIVGNKN